MNREIELAKKLLESKGYTVSNKVRESINNVKKRITHTKEFDNGHVLHGGWKRMSVEDSEEEAKQRSLEDPDNVYYVQYDDIMNPSSDNYWKNGQLCDYKGNPISVDESKKINESESTPREYYNKVQSILNHRLGYNEEYVTVENIDIISETPDTCTLKVDYEVSINIPMYDAEDGRTYYESDSEYRSQTMTFKNDELKESRLSDENIDDDPGESEQGRKPRPRRGRKPNGDEKDDKVFTPGSEDERDAKLKDSKNPLQKAILKSLNRLHESVDDDEDDDDYMWKPFQNGKYNVFGSKSIGREDTSDVNNVDTDSPAEAIEAWFKINKRNTAETSITTQTKSNAKELIDWAAKNIDKVESWYDKYGCHLKKDYLINSILSKHERGILSFYENEYGDQIDPFSVG